MDMIGRGLYFMYSTHHTRNLHFLQFHKSHNFNVSGEKQSYWADNYNVYKGVQVNPPAVRLNIIADIYTPSEGRVGGGGKRETLVETYSSCGDGAGVDCREKETRAKSTPHSKRGEG